MDAQACISSGLIAVHNFILKYDDCDLEHYLQMPELGGFSSSSQTELPAPTAFGQGSIPQPEYNHAVAYCDCIAGEM
jgi:hypothetical protein